MNGGDFGAALGPVGGAEGGPASASGHPAFRMASTVSNYYVDFNDGPEERDDFVSALATEAAREGSHERSVTVESDFQGQSAYQAAYKPAYSMDYKAGYAEPTTLPAAQLPWQPAQPADQPLRFQQLPIELPIPMPIQLPVFVDPNLSTQQPFTADPSATLQSTSNSTSRQKLARNPSSSSASTERGMVAPILLEMHREGSGDIALATQSHPEASEPPAKKRRTLRARKKRNPSPSPSASEFSDSSQPTKRRAQPSAGGHLSADQIPPKTLASTARSLFSLPPSSLSPAQMETVVRHIMQKRERNTEAARRSRGRRKEHIDWLESRVRELEAENGDLRARLSELENIVRANGLG